MIMIWKAEFLRSRRGISIEILPDTDAAVSATSLAEGR